MLTPTPFTVMKASSFGLDQVNVSFLQGKGSTLVISPRWDESAEFITKWLELNRSWVDKQILAYGAVFVRGFQITNPTEFERAVNALQPNLCDSYRGTSPRSLKDGCKYSFSAADAPVYFPIAQHLEMSFLKAPPRHLYFGCIKASGKPGGETSLCDFRKVYQELSPELRAKFATKKIKYSRKHHKVGERFTYDVGAMLGWPQLFGTSDPKEVERIILEEDAPAVNWIGKNSDSFLQEWVDEPFQKHPVTGEDVWFNHSQVFHWTTFSMELWHSFKRIRDFNLFIQFILVALFTFVKYGILGYKMALTTTFGDGTPISFQEMNMVRRAIHKNMVYSRWEKGDILCIDNFSTSHGRQPTYDRSRQVIVAWSNPCDKTSGVVESLDDPFTAMSADGTSKTLEEIPEIVESPDNSAASTMTKVEAQELKELVSNIYFQDQIAMAFSKQLKSKQGAHKRFASCPSLGFENEREIEAD